MKVEKCYKKILILLMLLLVGNNIRSEQFEVDGIRYEEIVSPTKDCTMGTVRVVSKGENMYAGDVVIPDTVVHGKIFYNKIELVDCKYVVIEIGSKAFANCDKLTSVDFGKSVIAIKSYSFDGCSELKKITIPEQVEYVDGCAFFNCEKLTEVEFNAINCIKEPESGNPAIAEYYDVFTGSPISIVKIGERVKKVPNKMFKKCTELTDVTISNSVTEIGESAFNGCTSLVDITIPQSVSIIGKYAFYCCVGLANVTIPESVTKIGESAFSYCRGLTNITIPNSETLIGNYAFSYCRGLTNITIPNRVTMGKGAFKECTGLTDVVFSNGVIEIPGYMFDGCTNIANVTIPKSVEKIGDYAFYDCYNIRSMTSQNPTPPQCGEKAFYGIKVEACPLYVPTESVSLYQTAYDWRDFWNIYGKEFSGIENLTIDEKEFSIEYYNLQGVKVENPDNGVYIKKQGSRMTKVVM